MDDLRLAQIDHFDQLSSSKRLEILKGINVHYCIQDDPHLTQQTRDRIGTTYLHVAASNSYYDFAKELLSQEVDFLKQKLEDGRTPVLTIADFYHRKKNYVWEMTGQLKDEMIDMLLSAQIKTGNASNPEDENGISHFHLAAAINHTKAITFFLNAEVPVDHAISSGYKYWLPGYTALHFAIRYSAIETAEILINYGADIFLKDAQGRSSLQLLIERLIDLADYINMGKRACFFVCHTERKRIESMVNIIFNSKTPDEMNFIDDTGLTAFHLACAMTDISVVESFLKENLNINASIHNDAEFWPGYTALHFAACSNVETVKLLLQRGSSIIKNPAGKTAMDLCMERYTPEIIHSILSCKPEFKNIVLSDGSTSLLDVLMLMNDCDQFNNFLQNFKNVELRVPHDSPLWPGNTLLHLSILMNEKTKTLKEFYESFIPEESTEASQKSYNCSEKEELAYWKRIVICLVRGCSLSTKNADGLTPIHLAFKLRKTNIVDKFLNSCKTNVADPNNLTHFHIACVIGKKSLVQRFLTDGVDVNSMVRSSFEWFGKPENSGERPRFVKVRANSTALHLAVIFEHVEIVELLFQNGADVHAQDACGFTPIHHSLKFDIRFSPTAQLLLKEPNLKEVISKQNLTHLHVAAWANDGQAVDKLLLQAGSEVDAVFDYAIKKPKGHYDDFRYFAGETPLYIAVQKKCGDAVRSLVRGGADMTKEITRICTDTAFVRSLSHMDSDATKCLVRRAKREFKEIVGPVYENGLTMLHVACASFDLVWVKKLLESGADVNARIRDHESEAWSGMTPLHVLVLEAYYASDKLPKNLMNLIKLLLKHGADVTIKDFHCTPLHEAHEHASEENIAAFSSVVDLLLRSHKSYDVNPTDYNGVSHVHVACLRNNVEIVEKFLDHGVDVNHHVDYFSSMSNGGFTCLHFALENRHVDLARMLINRGANVNAEARNGNRPIHVAVIKNCMDLNLLETLYRKGADFSVKNLKDMTPLMCLFMLENFTLEHLDFFLTRSSKFDMKRYRSSEGIFGLAMKNAKSSDRELIFQKLIETIDVKTAIRNGFNAIHSIVSVNQNGCLTLKFYVSAITQLVKMGCNLDQQNENGRAPIHEAAYFYNTEAIKALLQLGADINVVDTKNKSPLSTTVIANDKVTEERRADAVAWLLIHAWKMKLLGLTLKSSVEKDLLSLSNDECLIDSASQSRWQNELKRMEGVKISDCLTVKSFLYEGVSRYSLMTSSERELVDDFFVNNENMIQQFPKCSCLLNMQYRKAVLKFKLLQI